ncbi:hypothetical protein AAZX31_10G191400 [Glycine max]|uniref:RING-type E3 ubiquitin transferase n=2 Tax=Glycine subgen. Soja TaxID=1462606 RepID=I1LCR8_SOYBN|nr:RING-H2 finger protein ATL5 isoform X2 [Glycine max]XP_028186165.1 RING-H2 finger protein ATL5-like isoform X2 [Glycine soja]KAH1139190.1 hypothetical protein GYH30_028574 [Glycine max]KRH34736.1 hypothetical protein GLYMA_10G202500v4 [Glycine max]RZB88197.1 RING-H2 finger protein ATL7 isoform B [Glycine soja]|eukprot:XP_014618785.1 RING-H2 finger protein ATL5 isoform X2 [Glycine max]
MLQGDPFLLPPDPISAWLIAVQTLCCLPIEYDVILYVDLSIGHFFIHVQMERGCHGLERVTVAKFPTKKYSDKFFAAAENSQCTVCLSEYQGEDMLRILPYCGHSFHVTCIDLWLQQNSTCPVCRISLREFPDRKRLMQPLFSSALQPHYDIESFDNRHYHCMIADNGLSSRTPDNHAVNPIEEDHFPSEGDGAVAMDNITCLSEGDFIKDEGKKHVESPSNFRI